MSKIPEPETTIASLIDAVHESRQDKPRPHLGASMLGHHCDRWLWLSFRWAVQEKFPGRVLRLFRRGQNEEAVIVSDLRAIGIDVQSTGDAQSRVDFGKHVSGSIDGIAAHSVPGAPKKPHILEFKTHGDKSFKELIKAQSVKDANDQHWAQMQVYMMGKDIDRALYVAVNKNDDAIYTERVKLDKAEAQKLIERGHRIAMAERMPEPCAGASPDWYLCKFCAAHTFCHSGEPTKHANCRTCAHVTPCEDSTFRCERWADTVPVYAQHDGCPSHALNPQLVPWDIDAERTTDWVACYIIDGKPVMNGEGHFHSSEIIANPSVCAIADDGMMLLREKFDAKVVG